jgi:hypothetical protein
MMVLDTGHHLANLDLWETTSQEYFARQSGTPAGVICSTGPVLNIMQQCSRFNHLTICTCCSCNANREISNSKGMKRIVAGGFAFESASDLHFQLSSASSSGQCRPLITKQSSSGRRSVARSALQFCR